jgi:hypothetical protein
MSDTTIAVDAVEETPSTANYEHRLKCMACGLHYSVYSYDVDWAEQREGGSCPECGVRGRKISWGPVEMSDENGGRFIFQRVPGGGVGDDAVLMSGMWTSETTPTFGAIPGPDSGTTEEQ